MTIKTLKDPEKYDLIFEENRSSKDERIRIEYEEKFRKIRLGESSQ